VRLRADLAERNAELKREQEERTRRAVAEERATIARELHDVVSHAISVTVLQSRGARRMLGRDEESVRRALDAIEHTNTQALGDMRRLLAVLRDTEGDAGITPQPSLARLDDLVADVTESGLQVEVRETGEERDVPPGVDLSAYRIIQESLTNVLKHAGAARATVSLDYEPDQLRLSVKDDGRGAANVNGNGHGLVGIRERVAVVGGEIETGPGADGGFEVRARLPYSVEA
jgi:signal transduction histidine kinase